MPECFQKVQWSGRRQFSDAPRSARRTVNPRGKAAFYCVSRIGGSARSRSVPPCLGGLTGRPASCGLCLENIKRSASPSDPVEARTSKSPRNRAKVAIPVTSERPARRPASLAWDRPNSNQMPRSRSLGLAARDARPGLRPGACAGGAHDGHRDGLPETRAAAGRAVAGDRGPEPGCSECAAKMSKERGSYSALAEVAWACLPG